MLFTGLLFVHLHAPIMGHMSLLNATVGGSILIHCSLPTYLLSLRWFYWQEDQSNSILFHWDTSGRTQPIAINYRNRCEVFSTEFSSGNISIRLNNVTVEDDQKIFWAYVGFYHEKKKVSQQSCKSMLQVSAPYQDLMLTLNRTANSATCTARGGYPRPQVSWTGRNKSSSAQLQDAHMFLLQDRTEKTFSVTSCVSVKELQSVTCLIYNTHSNESIEKTTEIDAPREDQPRNHHLVTAITVLIVVIVAVVSLMCYRKCGDSDQTE